MNVESMTLKEIIRHELDIPASQVQRLFDEVKGEVDEEKVDDIMEQVNLAIEYLNQVKAELNNE